MKRVQGFVAGLLTAAVIMAYGVTAFAAGNGWNITMYPIKVLVNGEVLQPTDASGNPMEVFTETLYTIIDGQVVYEAGND